MSHEKTSAKSTPLAMVTARFCRSGGLLQWRLVAGDGCRVVKQACCRGDLSKRRFGVEHGVAGEVCRRRRGRGAENFPTMSPCYPVVIRGLRGNASACRASPQSWIVCNSHTPQPRLQYHRHTPEPWASCLKSSSNTRSASSTKGPSSSLRPGLSG